MGYQRKKSLNNEGGNSPYCFKLPALQRPHQGNLNKPETDEERLYCWFFWIEAILDPSLTRYVLDELDILPEFVAPWGADFYYGKKLKDKTYDLTVSPPEIVRLRR